MPTRYKVHCPDADIVPDPHFESGVVKIQHGQIRELTNNEKEAVRHLKISDDGGGADGAGGIGDSPDLLQKNCDHERKHKRAGDDEAEVVLALLCF